MKNINIEIEKPQIMVNGIVFDVKQSDMDILNKALQMENDFKKLDPADTSAIIAAINEIKDYIDEVLGEGALKKISKGAPIGLETAIKIMAAVCNEVVSRYSEGLNEKYDIFPEKEEE